MEDLEEKANQAFISHNYALAVRLLTKAVRLSDDGGSDRIKTRLNEAQKRLAEQGNSSSSSSSSSYVDPPPAPLRSSESSETKTSFTPPTTPFSPQQPAAADEANREAAEQCASRGAKALEEGDSATAVRLLTKALRLCPTLGPKVRGELQAAEQSLAARSGSSSSAASANDGVRKRQMGAAASPVASAPSYTPEMVEIVKQVKKAKDLYGVLGVARDADEDAIKRAYKKLALKVHPDKNTAPGADEAFKRVGKANAILLDPNERANYDRFGEASEHSAASGRGGGGMHEAAARQYHHGRQREQEISPEDIFNAFFGQGAMGGIHGMQGARVFHGSNGRVHFQRGGGAQPQQQQPPAEMFNENANFAQKLQGLMPLFLLFIFFASSMFGSTDEQYYALQQSRRHSKMRTTVGWNNVAKGLPYFVTDNVDLRLQSNQQLLYEVEINVQNDLKRVWSQNCRIEEQEKQSYLSYSKIAKSKSDKERYLKAHRDFKQPNCENMKNFFSQGGQQSDFI